MLWTTVYRQELMEVCASPVPAHLYQSPAAWTHPRIQQGLSLWANAEEAHWSAALRGDHAISLKDYAVMLVCLQQTCVRCAL